MCFRSLEYTVGQRESYNANGRDDNLAGDDSAAFVVWSETIFSSYLEMDHILTGENKQTAVKTAMNP